MSTQLQYEWDSIKLNQNQTYMGYKVDLVVKGKGRDRIPSTNKKKTNNLCRLKKIHIHTYNINKYKKE